MITQQTAAHLIKKMTHAVENPGAEPQDPTDELFHFYLKNRPHRIPQNVVNRDGSSINDQALVDVFQWRAADLSYRAYQARILEKKPWTKLMIKLHALSRAYSEQILVTTFYNALTSPSASTLSPPTPETLRTCFRLYALHTLDASASQFTLSNAVSPTTLPRLPDALLALLSALRPHAVKLVDAWAVPDWLLDSALGRYDGRVYEALFDMAHRRNPLNRTTFNPDWRSEEIVLGSADGGKHLLAKL